MTKLGTFIILQKRRNAGYYDRLDERRDRRISSEKIASIVNFESMLYFLTHMPYALGRSWTHRFQWGSMDPELQIPPAPPRIRSWKIIRIFSKLGSGILGCSTTLICKYRQSHLPAQKFNQKFHQDTSHLTSLAVACVGSPQKDRPDWYHWGVQR